MASSHVTLAGIGSLVSEASARDSFEFTNFRIGEVRGWRRAFNQANWVNLAVGGARLDTWEVAALAMVPAPGFVSRVALMDVKESDLSGFYEREAGYMIERVSFVGESADDRGEALLCTACQSDSHAQRLWAPGGLMEQHCAGSEYVVNWMRSSLQPLWPPVPAARQPLIPHLLDGAIATFDIAAMHPISDEYFPLTAPAADTPLYPAPGYLRGCYAAHRRAGMLDHFLDSTLLADCQTTLREYLASNVDLMEYIEDPDEDDVF